MGGGEGGGGQNLLSGNASSHSGDITGSFVRSVIHGNVLSGQQLQGVATSTILLNQYNWSTQQAVVNHVNNLPNVQFEKLMYLLNST